MKDNPENRILNSKKLGKLLELSNSKKTVFVIGSWDMLHVGQARFLMESKKMGDTLVVGVLSNKLSEVSAGVSPVLGQEVRAEMLLHLRCVDFATIIDEGIKTTINHLKPDILVLSRNRFKKDKEIFDNISLIKSGKTKVVIVERQSPFISSTIIMRKVTGAKLGHIFKGFLKLRKKPLKEESFSLA